jgi:hypothetical protein
MVQKSGHESACGKMCKDMTQIYMMSQPLISWGICQCDLFKMITIILGTFIYLTWLQTN